MVMVGGVIFSVAVATEGEDLVALVLVMLVLVETNICLVIGTTIWMGEDVGVVGDGSIIEETLLEGAGTEVTAEALKGLEHGVIAEVEAAVGAGAEV